MSQGWKLEKKEVSYEIYGENRFYAEFFPFGSSEAEETSDFPVNGGDLEITAIWFPRHVIEDLFNEGSTIDDFEEYLDGKLKEIREWKALVEALKDELGLNVRSDGYMEYKAYIPLRFETAVMNQEQLEETIFSTLRKLTDTYDRQKQNAESYRTVADREGIDVEILRQKLKCEWSLKEEDIYCFYIKQSKFVIGEFNPYPRSYELFDDEPDPIEGGELVLYAVDLPRHLAEDIGGENASLVYLEEYFKETLQCVRMWKKLALEVGAEVKCDGFNSFNAYVKVSFPKPIRYDDYVGKRLNFALGPHLKPIYSYVPSPPRLPKPPRLPIEWREPGDLLPVLVEILKRGKLGLMEEGKLLHELDRKRVASKESTLVLDEAERKGIATYVEDRKKAKCNIKLVSDEDERTRLIERQELHYKSVADAFHHGRIRGMTEDALTLRLRRELRDEAENAISVGLRDHIIESLFDGPWRYGWIPPDERDRLFQSDIDKAKMQGKVIREEP